MNVFFTDLNPIRAAQGLSDAHVNKMLTESCQMLSTAHRVLDGVEVPYRAKNGSRRTTWVLEDHRQDVLMKSTHPNHKCNVWVRAESDNYVWLMQHAFHLAKEFEYRFGKKQKCDPQISTDMWAALFSLPENIMQSNGICPSLMPTGVALALPKGYTEDAEMAGLIHSPMILYRAYIMRDKVLMDQIETLRTKRQPKFKWVNGRSPPGWLCGMLQAAKKGYVIPCITNASKAAIEYSIETQQACDYNCVDEWRELRDNYYTSLSEVQKCQPTTSSAKNANTLLR